MAPKFDPNEIPDRYRRQSSIIQSHRFEVDPFLLVILRVVGGEVAGGSTLAPKIGPLGLVGIAKCFLEFPELIFLLLVS